jgi:3-phenylpropionate/trans-cinnamate dioxygenase ferredoxin subunit
MAETTSESHFYRLGLVKDFPQGERIFIEIDHKPIVIFCLGGEFYAIGDVCTHDGGAIGEGEI